MEAWFGREMDCKCCREEEALIAETHAGETEREREEHSPPL